MEVTEFKCEVRNDLQGRLETTMASEATKMTVGDNMHMDTRVNNAADLKSEGKFEL